MREREREREREITKTMAVVKWGNMNGVTEDGVGEGGGLHTQQRDFEKKVMTHLSMQTPTALNDQGRPRLFIRLHL